MKTETPVYQKIAQDLAMKIVEGVYAEGDVITGRSTLAGLYQTSPETIRRAAMILEDVRVLKSSKGKGYVVLSKHEAEAFLNNRKTQGHVNRQRYMINSLLKDKAELDEKLTVAFHELIEYTTRIKEQDVLIPFEFDVTQASPHVGKTIAELRFWQNTGGTVVGVKRNGKKMISPGPYIVVEANDILLVVGDDEILKTVPKFLLSTEK